MKANNFNGQFATQQVSASDLERGYSDTGYIPETGENIFNPESVAHEKQEKKWLSLYEDDTQKFEGGFLSRDDDGYERY